MVTVHDDFCFFCKQEQVQPELFDETSKKSSNSQKYPKYFKSVEHLDEVDVYEVCDLFKIDDSSGATQHTIKKLLLSGQRTGNKTLYMDLKEARDTLNRRLEMLERAS